MYKIKLYGAYGEYLNCEIKCNTFEAFKVKLLKHFGNVDGSIRENKTKLRVKQLIKSAETMDDILSAFKSSHGFSLEVK
ncbi:hypothetical protein [Globicatella sanguinis]|uniref:hypothetical protein n=1 Tax=Globicatella sanguinis TaxID=13076 RepID=UPI0012ED1925|nr:hypothetical protein [Globicatella sanguinis]